jgi:hypothetical protein
MIGKGKKFSVVVRAGGRAACSPAACSPAAVSPAVQLREKRENREKREKRAYRDRTRSNLQLYRRLLRPCFPIHRQGGLFLILFSLLISSCSPGTPTATTPEVVSVYSSLAAEPWLSEFYDCAAGQANIVLSRVDDPDSAQIAVRIGEPEFLSSFAYQIDEENIVVIMNNARPAVVNLQQIKGMFLGQITNMNQITLEWGKAHLEQSGEVHVWVFSPDDDVQQVFDKLILDGRPIISSAKLATTPQEMLEAIQNDLSAIGVLNQRWNPNNDVYEEAIIATVPVLVMTKSEPQGVVKELIACLQK